MTTLNPNPNSMPNTKHKEKGGEPTGSYFLHYASTQVRYQRRDLRWAMKNEIY